MVKREVCVNKNSIAKMLDYYSKPLTKDRISFLNTFNAVEPEKVELYRDFIISLGYTIADSYLGSDVMENEEDIKSHYDWCWKKNISNFALENLHFEVHGEHYYYFYKYFRDVFYNRNQKPKSRLAKISTFWEETFSMDRLKTHSEYDVFINIYKILTKNFKNNFT